MKKAEIQQAIRKLHGLWPGVPFSDDELELFGRTCAHHELRDVVGAMEDLKLRKAGYPTLAEIFSPVREKARKENTGEYRSTGSLADVVRRFHPDAAGMSDAEIIVRYHRQQADRATPAGASVAEWIVRRCMRDLAAAGFESGHPDFLDRCDAAARLILLDRDEFNRMASALTRREEEARG